MVTGIILGFAVIGLGFVGLFVWWLRSEPSDPFPQFDKDAADAIAEFRYLLKR